MDVFGFDGPLLAVVLGCLVLGLLFLAVEVLVVPGVGVPGIIGVSLIIFGIAYALWNGGVTLGLFTIGVAGLTLYLGARIVGFTVASRLVLDEKLSEPPDAGAESELIGREGVTLTPLRPAGIGRFGMRRVDVVSRSEFLNRGEKIVVVEVEGNRVVVDRRTDEAPATAG